jgi:hypothetical protein
MSTLVAVAIGIAMGAASLNAGQISSISANPILGVPQEILVFALIPGLFSAALTGSLWTAAFINAVLWFGVVWTVLFVVRRFRRRSANGRAGSEDALG